MFVVEQQVTWETASGQFKFQLSGGIGRVTDPDGLVFELAMSDWLKLASAIGLFGPEKTYLQNANAAKPANAGNSWDAKQESQLAVRFENQKSMTVLAREFGRTPGAIKSRLQKLGLVA
jgi:hypothetical protein